MASKVKAEKTLQGESDLLAFVSGEKNVAAVQEAVRTLPDITYNIFEGTIKDMTRYLAQKGSPRIIVVDVSQSDLPLSELNELAEVCDPSVQVIVVGMRNDVGLYRDLMGMGVYDYLVAPIMPDILARSLQGALDGKERPSAVTSREGKVVTCLAARGGSGATTIATNLAWLLAVEKKRRVVIVDMNLHLGTVALSFDLRPDHGLREALENPDRVDEVFVDRLLVKVNERLEVLSSEESLDSYPSFHFEGFDNLLKVLKKKYHFIILDIPRRFTKITQHVLEHTNILLLTAEPSIASIRDVDRIYSQFITDGDDCRAITILNKVGQYRKGELTPHDFEKATKKPVHHVIPFDGNTALDCLNKGVILSSVDSKMKMSLDNIVSDLTGGSNVAVEKKGLFERVKTLLNS